MKTIVHVNQHNIKHNAKHGNVRPVLTVKDYKQNRKGQVATIKSSDGTVLGRFIYSPNKPLSCGAKVWFETSMEVEVS